MSVHVNIPGMMLLPGSFSGKLSSPSPHLGPDPRNRMSLAIFITLAATTFRAPCTSTNESWAASDSNLFGEVTKGNPAVQHVLSDQL